MNSCERFWCLHEVRSPFFDEVWIETNHAKNGMEPYSAKWRLVEDNFC